MVKDIDIEFTDTDLAVLSDALATVKKLALKAVDFDNQFALDLTVRYLSQLITAFIYLCR